MADDIVEEIWEKGKEKEKRMTREEIERFLRPDIKRHALRMHVFVWIYLGVLVTVLILQGINMGGYWSNPLMLAIQGAALLIALGFLAYGIHLLLDMRRIDQADESLTALLHRRLRFYRTKYEIWLWVVAGSTLLIIFSVNTMVDNVNGHYRINKPGFFIAVQVAIFLFIYGVNKIAHYPFVKELRAFLHDLEAQVTEETENTRAFKRTWRRWGVLFFLIATALFLWGIFRMLHP